MFIKFPLYSIWYGQQFYENHGKRQHNKLAYHQPCQPDIPVQLFAASRLPNDSGDFFRFYLTAQKIHHLHAFSAFPPPSSIGVLT
ncbi:MAG: hypothetical protein R2861_15995 [Desulfobacterales bacterium]